MDFFLQTPDNFQLSVRHQKVSSTTCVILCHGMTVHKDDEPVFTKGEQDLQNRGFSTISFDFRGHGKSSGDSAVDFSIAGELVDLETIHTFGQNEGYTSIGLAGASFGGSIASL